MVNTDDLVPFTINNLMIMYPLAVMDIKRQLRCHKMGQPNKYKWFLQCKPNITYHTPKWSAWVVCIADGVTYSSGMVSFQPADCVNKPIQRVRIAEILIEDVTERG